jgi:hypothetical protein
MARMRAVKAAMHSLNKSARQQYSACRMQRSNRFYAAMRSATPSSIPWSVTLSALRIWWRAMPSCLRWDVSGFAGTDTVTRALEMLANFEVSGTPRGSVRRRDPGPRPSSPAASRKKMTSTGALR